MAFDADLAALIREQLGKRTGLTRRRCSAGWPFS
jgi:hypothetical protein